MACVVFSVAGVVFRLAGAVFCVAGVVRVSQPLVPQGILGLTLFTAGVAVAERFLVAERPAGRGLTIKALAAPARVVRFDLVSH